MDNDYFPWELKEQMEWDKANNVIKYNHIWLGELNEVPEGALWKYDYFQYEDIDYKECEKIVVALDPSGTSKSTSDACGLIVSGKRAEDLFVFADETAIMSPKEWASKAVALYHKYEADEIVYESNFGGDMTKIIISQIDKTVPVKEVRATRGKIIRAEPIVFLYQEGKVFHTKKFKDLEWEMCTYSGATTDRSPNRLDALVYSLSALAVNKKLAVSSGMNFRM
jgi:phage terminase large subunit-like protein